MKPIPDGYHTVTPYLIVQGAADLIAFTQAAFGAAERTRNAGPGGSIMHAEVQIGDSVLMLSDASDAFGTMPMMLHLYVEDCDVVYRQALAAGAESVREPADQPYGDRSAGVKDRWGNQWWLATQIKNV